MVQIYEMTVVIDLGHVPVRDPVRDLVPQASLRTHRAEERKSIEQIKSTLTQRYKGNIQIPAVGFLGLTLGVSSTSNVSRFKLSGRI